MARMRVPRTEQRNTVERSVNHLKQRRGLTTPYDIHRGIKLALAHQASHTSPPSTSGPDADQRDRTSLASAGT